LIRGTTGTDRYRESRPASGFLRESELSLNTQRVLAILFVLTRSLIAIRAQFPRRTLAGSNFLIQAYTVLTGDTVYGTAGGDIVEHAAQPRERSSDTARGSGNPRDTASTSPSTLEEPRTRKKTATGGATH